MVVQYLQVKESLKKLLQKGLAPPVSNSDQRGMGLRPRILISSNATCDSDEVFLRPHLGKLNYSKNRF